MRLFLALWPSLAVRAALAAQRNAIAWPAAARPTPDEKLHLTLHFIGSVPAARLPELVRAFDVPAGETVDLRLDSIALWRGGVVALQPLAVPPPLRALHTALADALRASALPVETRPFRPHVTLARECAGHVPLPAPPALHWRVRGHALVESTPDGRYRVLQRYPQR